MHKSAFTLVEMLVATMVFVIGFVAIYSLFLAGINYRHESDRLTSTALAATSLISNWRLQMQDQWGPVDDFIGDGDPSNGPESADSFFPFPDNPHIWYCVHDATDAAGLSNSTGGVTDASSTVRLEILLIDLGASSSATSLTLQEIKARQFVDESTADGLTYVKDTFSNALENSAAYDLLSDADKALYILIWRKVLVRQEAVILRR